MRRLSAVAAFVSLNLIWPATFAAANSDAAHSLAAKFAGAHDAPSDKTPDAPVGPDNANRVAPSLDVGDSQSMAAPDNDQAIQDSTGALTPEDVREAFERRKQETDLKSQDALIKSVEERTKAIEKLLERTSDASWQTDVNPDAPTPEASVSAGDIAQGLAPAASAAGGQVAPAEPAVTEAQAVSEKSAVPPNDSRALPAVLPEAPPEPETPVREFEKPTYALGAPKQLLKGLGKPASGASRATILMIMEPGGKGIRRFKKTGDPVLCSRFHCYRSQGAGRSATKLSRGDILGPFNTLGLRAGACRNQLTCAFRDIEIDSGGTTVQPVDLKILKHDRRPQLAVVPDTSCKVMVGRLFCANAVVTSSWKAWVVPEAVAREAGAVALEAALEDGLPGQPPQAIVAHPETR